MLDIIEDNKTKTNEINNIYDISKETYFFIQVKTQIEKFVSGIDKNKIIPDINYINIIKEELNEMKTRLKNNYIDNNIEIKKEFYDALINLKEKNKENSYYAKRIKEIYDDYKGEKKITLKNIQIQYQQKNNQYISLMTISRILRNHLKIHYRKTTLKNPKLSNDNYLLMAFCFLFGIVKALKDKISLIYIDETGFELCNNNLYLWRKNDATIYGGPTNDNKKRINVIMAIDKNEIILAHYYNGESIGTNEFITFMEEIIEKIGKNRIVNYMFILDNASYHLSKDVKEFSKKNKIKILFNIPYKSEFNAIEIAFHLIKNNLYKEMPSNQKELIKRIIYYIDDKSINDYIPKVYIKTLETYVKFYEDNLHKINSLSLTKKKRKRNNKKRKSKKA